MIFVNSYHSVQEYRIYLKYVINHFHDEFRNRCLLFFVSFCYFIRTCVIEEPIQLPNCFFVILVFIEILFVNIFFLFMQFLRTSQTCFVNYFGGLKNYFSYSNHVIYFFMIPVSYTHLTLPTICSV